MLEAEASREMTFGFRFQVVDARNASAVPPQIDGLTRVRGPCGCANRAEFSLRAAFPR